MPDILFCACCGLSSADLRARYPFRATVRAINPYGLPIGKTFLFAAADPPRILGHWPAYFHGREYVMPPEAVDLEEPE